MKFRLILLSIVTILTTGFNLQSQHESYDTLSRSVGVSAGFINNFIPLDGNVGFSDKHLLHYIKYKSPTRFVRQAADINIQSRITADEDLEKRKDTRFDLEYKVGKGRKKSIFKKGYLMYGPEFLFDYTFIQAVGTGTFDSTARDQSIGFSAGPFLGIEYKITKRISLYTQASFYLNINYTRQSFKQDIGGSDEGYEFRGSTTNITENFRLPSSLILFYSF